MLGPQVDAPSSLGGAELEHAYLDPCHLSCPVTPVGHVPCASFYVGSPCHGAAAVACSDEVASFHPMRLWQAPPGLADPADADDVSCRCEALPQRHPATRVLLLKTPMVLATICCDHMCSSPLVLVVSLVRCSCSLHLLVSRCVCAGSCASLWLLCCELVLSLCC